MKERVTFALNVPVTTALAYPDGIKVEGRYGDQVMYSLNDGRVMTAHHRNPVSWCYSVGPAGCRALPATHFPIAE